MSYHGTEWETLPRTNWFCVDLVIEVRNDLGRTTTHVYYEDDAEEAFRLDGGPYGEALIAEIYGIKNIAYDLGVAAGQNILAGKLRLLLGVKQ